MAAPGDRTADRRVQRTRRALDDALLALLPRLGWDGISVRDLCEQADIGRSTFYLHFQNKEELLVTGLDNLRRQLRAQAGEAGDPTTGRLAFVRGLIEHIGEQKALYRSLIGRSSGHVVQTRFREMVVQLFEEDIAGVVAAGWQRDAGVRCVAGALVELLAWWVDAGKDRSAGDLERYFHRLAMPIITELSRSGP